MIPPGDITAITYFLICLVAICGAGLFIWYWIMMGARGKKKASAVYIYVLFWLVGEGLSNGLGLYARWLRHKDMFDYYDFTNSPIWMARDWTILVCLGAMVFHLARKAHREWANDTD